MLVKSMCICYNSPNNKERGCNMSGAFKHTVRAVPGESISLTVTYSGHQKCEPSQRWGKGVREQFILHFIVSGKGTYITPEGSFSLSAGDIFLIRPLTEIEYFADNDDPWEYYWVNFGGSDADAILGKTDFSASSPVMHGCGADVAAAMENILSCPAKELFENVELTGRLYILLSLLIKKSNSAQQRENRNLRRLEAAKAFIETNYPLPISADDIADAADITRITLFRLFKSELGITPAEYLIRCRMSRAKNLLSSTDLSIGAVARSAGYEDGMYFSRAFRKAVGISPSEYRQSKK